MENNIPYEQIENGALILLLLTKSKTWEELCGRYAHANPAKLRTNTNAMTLRDKLIEMRDLGLISFKDEETEGGKKPVGEIKDTGLWSKIRVSFGGMSLSEAAMLSRHSTGMAVTPVFGRPRQPDEKIDVFVLMPFNAKMEKVYTNHIKKMGEELGLIIRRADTLRARAVYGKSLGWHLRGATNPRRLHPEEPERILRDRHGSYRRKEGCAHHSLGEGHPVRH